MSEELKTEETEEKPERSKEESIQDLCAYIIQEHGEYLYKCLKQNAGAYADLSKGSEVDGWVGSFLISLDTVAQIDNDLLVGCLQHYETRRKEALERMQNGDARREEEPPEEEAP